MFKITRWRDLSNEDPKKRKRIKGLIFSIGYECDCLMDCPHYYDCKYRGKRRFRNRLVDLSRWIYYKFNIKVQSPIWFQSYRTNLSGTTKCPYKVDRIYTCYQCKYLGCVPKSDLGLGCTNEKYIKASWNECHDENTPPGRCKFFELDPWYANYDRKTGDYIHD